MACNDCLDLEQGEPGYNGWYFLLADVEDTVNLDANGDSRIVQQITGYAGGTGPTPTTYIGYYLGTTGPVTAIASATNVKGDQGTSYDLTSTTNLNLPIANGSQALTVSLSATQSAYKVGARIRVSDSTNPTTNYFEGVITAYSGTTLTLLIDFSTDVVDTNIATWNINIAGEPAAGLGFDNEPWVTYSIPGGELATSFIYQTALPIVGASNLVIDNGVYIYKKLGKTLILSFYGAGTQDIGNGAFNIAFLVKIPGSFLHNQPVHACGGFCYASVNNSNPATTNNYPSVTLTYATDDQYLRIGNFSGTAAGANTALDFSFYGAITFEIQ